MVQRKWISISKSQHGVRDPIKQENNITAKLSIKITTTQTEAAKETIKDLILDTEQSNIEKEET